MWAADAIESGAMIQVGDEMGSPPCGEYGDGNDKK